MGGLCLLVGSGGCSILDRKGDPQILEVNTDQDEYTSVGRGSKVTITLFAEDPDNDELDYLWTSEKAGDPDGSRGRFEKSNKDSLKDLFQSSVTVVWQAPGQIGEYLLRVRVRDRKDGTVVEDMLTILVTQGPPSAEAGPDLVLAYNDALVVVLDGTGSSDPDRDALQFIWEQIGGPGVSLGSGGTDMPSFRATAPADYIFVLRVSDTAADTTGALTSEPDTVVVRVDDRSGRGRQGS